MFEYIFEPMIDHKSVQLPTLTINMYRIIEESFYPQIPIYFSFSPKEIIVGVHKKVSVKINGILNQEDKHLLGFGKKFTPRLISIS